VVQTLVSAGGTIRANTVGNQPGRIEITGTGGSVVVEGRLAADGHTPGSTGGQVMVAASNTTTIAPTAHVTANGRAGGGTIAIGTTLARAQASGTAPAGTSTRTVIAPGARVAANATTQGNGGRITVLSTQDTHIGGALATRGGPQGGDGGTIEMSGMTGFSLTGTADTSAPLGHLGTIVLDPTDLTIVANSGADTITPVNGADPAANIPYGATPATATVREATIEGLTGNIYLQATNNLTVAANLSLGTRALKLEAGNNLTVNAGTTITTSGAITLTAAASGIPGFNAAGALSIQGTVQTTGSSMSLSAGTGGVSIGAAGSVSTIGTLVINTTGAFTEAATGTIAASDMQGTASSVSLPSTTNQINGIGSSSNPFTVTGATGDFSLTDAVSPDIGTSSITGGISVQSGRSINLRLDGVNLFRSTNDASLSAPGGTVSFTPLTAGRPILLTTTASGATGLYLTLAELTTITASTLQLGALDGTNTAPTSAITLGKTGEAINLTTNGGFSTLRLTTSGAVSQGNGLTVQTLTGQAGSLSLPVTTNAVQNLAGFTTANDLTLATSTGLTASGTIASTGGAISLTSAAVIAGDDINRSMILSGNISAATSLTAQTNSTLETSGTLTAPTISLTSTNTATAGGGISQTGGTINGSSTVTLTSAAAINQTGGGITTASLGGSSTGSTTLTSSSNAVTALKGFSSAGGFSLTNGQSLSVNGAVNDGTSVALSVSGDLSLGDTIATATLTTTASGAITQPGGTLRVTTLAGSANTANFGQSANRIGTLGNFTVTNSLALTDAVTVAIGGAVRAGTGGSITLTDDSVGFGTGGTLTAAGGTVTIAGLTNTPLTFGGGTTTFTPPITARTLVLGRSGGGALTIGGGLNLPNISILDLESAGAVTEAGNGAITVGTLTGNTASAQLSGNNQLSTLGSFTTTGGFTLQNGAALTVSGPLTASAISLTAAGDMTLAGTLTTTGTLSFTGFGAINQTGGSITAASLSGTAAGASLAQSGNQIATLASFSSTGDFTLADSTALTVTGAVSAGSGRSLTLLDNALTVSGGSLTAANGSVALREYTQGNGLTLSGTIPVDAALLTLGSSTGGPIVLTGALTLSNAPLLDLESSGTVIETSTGSINATALTGTTGSATLNGANQIGTLSNFTTAGAFSLNTLGNLLLSGRVTTPGTLTLTAGGAITQSGGSITTGRFTGRATTASFNQTANAITTLAGFQTTGDFSLTNGQSLTVTAPVDPTTITLTVAGNLALNSSLTAGTVVLNASGAITQGGSGQIIATTLTGSAQSAQLTGPNQLTTLGNFQTQGTLALTNTGDLGLSGTIAATTLNLNTGGAITQTSGALTTGSLNAAAGGGLSLGIGGTASIGAIGTLAAPSITLSTAGPLVLSGNSISANTATLQSLSGTLQQLGTTILQPYSGSTASFRPAAGGLTSFNSLSAPAVDLTLALGSGRATGRLVANSLALEASGGSATLTGTVAGLSDTGAALISRISPLVSDSYTLNGCTIAAQSCTTVSIDLASVLTATLPIASVLRPGFPTLGILDLSVTRDPDDPTILLPNISDRDY
jgi:hypothetical protein